MHTLTLAQRAILAVAALALTACAATPRYGATPGGYLGQPAPGARPALFAPGVVSTPDAVELNGVLSPDGREFFFTRMVMPPGGGEGVFRMYRCVLDRDGRWSEPEHVQVYEEGATSLAVDMAYTRDGQRLYFLGNHPSAEAPATIDIWVTTRTDDGGWSRATRVPEPVSTEHGEFYPSLTPDDDLQFASNRPGSVGSFDLWRAERREDNTFAEPVNMGEPVNSIYSEGDSCVAPDGSYIVFSAGRPEGPGNGDLYVSFRTDESAGWTEPVLLGHGVNTEHTDYCPMVTPDGRYLFFSRRISEPPGSGWNGVVGGNVYWIDAQIIEDLRP